MPFAQIHVPAKFTPEIKIAISQSVHQSLVSIFNIPQDDYFHAIHTLEPGNLLYPDSYLGIPHTDNFIYVYITCGVGRTVEMKQNLYTAIVEKIAAATPIAPDDVMIMLNEIPWENWSFGQGKAQMIGKK